MKILISACLLGEAVRYDGRDNAHKVLAWQPLIRQWQALGWLVPVCPEVLGGLPIPRSAAEIQNGDGHHVIARQTNVKTCTGSDVTSAFIAGAECTLTLAREHQADIALLAARSPSCGKHTIYDGSFSGTQVMGMGVTVALLEQQGIRCFNPEEIDTLQKVIQSRIDQSP